MTAQPRRGRPGAARPRRHRRAVARARASALRPRPRPPRPAQLSPVALDRRRPARPARAGELPPLLRGLVRVPARRQGRQGGSLASRLAAVAAEESAEAIVLELVREPRRRRPRPRLGAGDRPRAGLQGLGFDSLAAVELRNRLARRTGLQLPADPGLRLPDPGARWPGSCAQRAEGAAAPRAAPRSGRRPLRGADRDRRHELPLPRRRRLPPGALGAGRRRSATRSPPSPPTAAGTWSALYDPDPEQPRHQLRARGRLPRRRRPTSTPSSSASSRARRWRWTPSSGCCWKPPGRRWRTRGSTRRRCAAAATGVFAGVMHHDYGLGLGAEARGLSRHRRVGQRRLRPRRLRARPRGPGGHRRHRLLLLAGGDAPGRARRCAGASASWRWPAG